MNRAIAALVPLLIALPCAAADTKWQFLRVRRDLSGATGYVPTTGTAKVSIDKARIHIDAFRFDPNFELYAFLSKEARDK